jgi:hypothetical protein
MKLSGFLLLAVTLLTCCGCVPIPYRAVVRPGVEGYLVDAHTRQPIRGATIRMLSTNFYMLSPTTHQLGAISRESENDGAFMLPPERAWRVELTPNFAPNDRSLECNLLISHPAYEPARMEWRLMGETLFWQLPRMTNVGTINLMPLSR